MTKVIPPEGCRAPVNASELEIIQLHAQAENALSMALHYLRHPVANLPGASRKAVQALAALNKLGGALAAPSIHSTQTQGG